MVLAKAGQEFQLTLNSKQKHFGVTNFNVETINLEDGTVEKQNVNVVEIIKSIDNPATATVVADALKGQKTISVKDSNILDGMVFKDANGHMYYIESVDTNNNTITTRIPLVEDIAANDTLNQVGNTGIYKIPLNITKPGKYNVAINNPSVNLRNLASFVEVMQFDIDDLGNKIETSRDELSKKIDAISNKLDHSDGSDYEIVS